MPLRELIGNERVAVALTRAAARESSIFPAMPPTRFPSGEPVSDPARKPVSPCVRSASCRFQSNPPVNAGVCIRRATAVAIIPIDEPCRTS